MDVAETTEQKTDKSQPGSCGNGCLEKSGVQEHSKGDNENCTASKRSKGYRHTKLPSGSSVYVVQCLQCLHCAYTRISGTNAHLPNVLQHGVGIYCTRCKKNSKAVVKMDKLGKVTEGPLYRCLRQGCETNLFASLKSWSGHMSSKHPDGLEVCSSGVKDKHPLDHVTSSQCSQKSKEKVSKPGQKVSKFDRKSTKKSYRCPVIECTAVYNRKCNLKLHEQRHSLENDRSCSCVGASSASEDDRPPENTSKKEKSTDWTAPYNVSCGVCKKMYTVKIHKESKFLQEGLCIKCLGCGTITRNAMLSECHADKPVYGGLEFVCPEETCLMDPFHTLARLNDHVKHHSMESVTCDLCGEAVRNQKSLRHHKAICSGLINPCRCSQCPMLCRNQYHLLQHMRNVHSDGKYSCNECSLFFRSKASLQKHQQRQHGYEKPVPVKGKSRVLKDKSFCQTHICDVCHKSYATDVLLRQHYGRTHIDKTKPCSDCGKLFKTTHQLKRHVQRHHEQIKNFYCITCNKRFHQNWELVKHVTCHHGTKPLVCSYCGQVFKSKSGLTSHEDRHKSDQSRADCVYCGETFTSRNDLTLHLQKHLS